MAKKKKVNLIKTSNDLDKAIAALRQALEDWDSFTMNTDEEIPEGIDLGDIEDAVQNGLVALDRLEDQFS
jgi:hypothetical protein